MLYTDIISFLHVYFCDLIVLGGLVQPLATLITSDQSNSYWSCFMIWIQPTYFICSDLGHDVHQQSPKPL